MLAGIKGGPGSEAGKTLGHRGCSGVAEDPGGAGTGVRGTTEKGEYRSHACMTMIEPNSWGLNEVKDQPYPLQTARLYYILLLVISPRFRLHDSLIRVAAAHMVGTLNLKWRFGAIFS